MTEADMIFMFFSRTYENDVNKKILDDRNFVIPKERLLAYVRTLNSIPYQSFLSYLNEHPLDGITSRNITQCSSFAACEIELCQGILALNNPGLSNIEVGHLFPKYVTSRTETAFVKYGENQAKTGMQLGLTFNYFGYWYLSCIGYVYGELTREEKLCWLARALLRDELYSRIICDCLIHDVDLLDYMDCLSSDSTKLRRCGCVEYLTSLCLQECDKGSIKHGSIQSSIQTLKKKDQTGTISSHLHHYYGELADDKLYLPVNVKRRFSRCAPITLDGYKQIAHQPILGHHIPNYSDLYIYNLSTIPNLSYQDEKILFERAATGDSAAKDAIIESVLPYVPDLIKPFLEYGIERDDLIQEANCALISAFYSYRQSDYNIRFLTYALIVAKTHINNIIPQYFPVHVSNEYYRYVRKIHDVCSHYYNHNGIIPSFDELADIISSTTNFPIDKLSEVYYSIDLEEHPFIQQCPILEIDDCLIDQLPANIERYMTIYPPINSKFQDESLSVEVLRALTQLTPREEDILKMFFGIREPEKTLEEIGAKLGLTRERVRQLKEKAVRRLYYSLQSKVLKTYLGGNNDIDIPYGTESLPCHNVTITEYISISKIKEYSKHLKQNQLLTIEKAEEGYVQITENELHHFKKQKIGSATHKHKRQEFLRQERILKRKNREENKAKSVQLSSEEMVSRIHDIKRYLALTIDDFDAVPDNKRNHGKLWLKEEQQILKELYYSDKAIAYICKIMGRTEISIYAKLVNLGVITKEENPYYHPKE